MALAMHGCSILRAHLSPVNSNNRFDTVLVTIMLGWTDRAVAQRVIFHTNAQLETIPTALKSQAGLQIFFYKRPKIMHHTMLCTFCIVHSVHYQ
jgi:hypothetical protein